MDEQDKPKSKRGRKKTVATCSVCAIKINIVKSYTINNKYCCKKCYNQIVKQKRGNHGHK